MKKKVFISFDYDHDDELKRALIAQAKNPDSPFSINDMSIKEAIDANWKKYARDKIKQCDIIIVICGKHTDTARGVAAELTITQEEKKSYFLLWGRPDGTVKKPTSVNCPIKLIFIESIRILLVPISVVLNKGPAMSSILRINSAAQTGQNSILLVPIVQFKCGLYQLFDSASKSRSLVLTPVE